jgi:hypothetical protein
MTWSRPRTSTSSPYPADADGSNRHDFVIAASAATSLVGRIVGAEARDRVSMVIDRETPP